MLWIVLLQKIRYHMLWGSNGADAVWCVQCLVGVVIVYERGTRTNCQAS